MANGIPLTAPLWQFTLVVKPFKAISFIIKGIYIIYYVKREVKHEFMISQAIHVWFVGHSCCSSRDWDVFPAQESTIPGLNGQRSRGKIILLKYYDYI